MRFWSKGLGKRCLAMDCGTEAARVEGSNVVLAGTVRPPLGWGYTITMDAADWLDFVELALNPTTIRYLSRRRRRGLALRAGWHMALLFVACAARLPGVWIRHAARALDR